MQYTPKTFAEHLQQCQRLYREKSIAQHCLEAADPFLESAKRQCYKGMPTPYLKRFHFEDNSYLDFAVSYAPLNAGRSIENV